MKVLVLEFHQESNSFCPVTSTMEDYERCSVLSGADFRKSVEGKLLAPSGMFQVLREEGAAAVPGYAMRAPAGGPVEHAVFTHFLEHMRLWVKKSLPLDGILVSLHGATQTTELDDACGVILEELRRLAGKNMVIAASLDLHANVTAKMFRNADFLCGYWTYPHVDVFETGCRAARLAVRKMSGEQDLCMAWARVPMIIPASGYTTSEDPLCSLVEEAQSLIRRGVLEDYSIFQMQPWLDVKEGGGAVLAIGRQKEAACFQAERMAQELFSMRDQMQPTLATMDEVIIMAEESEPDRPLVVVDFSDSTNAGAAGDSAYIVEELLKRGSRIKTAFVLIDRPAVESAFQAGVGAVIQISVGGTRAPACSRPVPVRVKVRSLHDGEFLLEGPSMRGVEANVGRTAVLSVGTIDLVVCEAMASTGDPQLYRHFGIEPTLYQMVVVKANTSFRAAYESMAGRICFVDTKCAATADLEHLPFRRLPRTLYPFTRSTGGKAKAEILCRPQAYERSVRA